MNTLSTLTVAHASDLQAKLFVSEQRLRLAIDTAQLASWELDTASGAFLPDMRCRSLHGLHPALPLSLDALIEAIDERHRSNAEEAIRSVVEAQGPAGFEIEYAVPHGQGERWLFTRGQVLITESGPRAIAAVLDVSARRRQEEAAKKRAELYQQLVGIVSHDLKNPVQVIMAGLSLLEEGTPLGERRTSILRRVRNATDRAGRLISDLLDFTRDRLGEGIPVVRQPVDLAELVREVVGGFAMARPDVRIELEIRGDTSALLDPDRMEQVAINLLDNAIEYSDEGEPVAIELAGTEDALELSVFAHGEPITGELIPRLFEPLSPAVQQRNRRRAGLGLYIVRAIAEGHGGTVEVSSSDEETRFRVLLPRRPL